MMLCKHCKTPLYSDQSEFCCNGCSVAYKIITSLDLGQYYKYYMQLLGKAPPAVESFDNQLDYIGQVTQNNEIYSTNLVVDGLHCGACVWVIEHFMQQQLNIVSARVNLTTRRLSLEWRGKKEDIASFVESIQRLGYRLTPYDPVLYDEQEQVAGQQMLKQLAVAGFGFLQAMMVVIAVWAGHWSAEVNPHTKHMLHFITAMIAVPCIIYSMQPFVRSAYSALSNKRSNMDVAIVLAVVITMIISIVETIHNNSYTYFDSVLMLIFFLLIGRYIDLKIRNKVGAQAKRLLLSQPQIAMIERSGTLVLAHISKVHIGDIIRVAVGEKIALDGMVVEGSSSIDASIITGETMPHAVHPGDQVYAGSLNIDGPIRIRVIKLGNDSLLAEMMRLIDIASRQQSKFVRIADRVAGFYTPLVILLAIGTFAYWYYIVGAVMHLALINAVAVLLITCPCALALAIPAVYITATSKLMQRGVLLKNADALEKLTQIDSVYLDKTGTITYGKPEWINPQDFSEAEKRLLKTLSASSKHPLCLSLQKSLQVRDIKNVTQVEEVPGQGMKALYNNSKVLLGSRNMAGVTQINNDDYMEIWFVQGNMQKRLIFEDLIRPEVKDVIAALKQMDLDVALVSGDRAEIVKVVADSVGIDLYHSALLPQQKYQIVEQQQTAGKKILMLGDGLNDSAVMKLAHCSMSPSGAIDLTRSIADVIYPGSLQAVIYTIKIAQCSQRLVRQNLAFSLAYNLVMIPSAMMGDVTPAVAALFMSISSITVVLNAMRLGRNLTL